MEGTAAESYLTDAIASFRNYKKLAERALEQVSDEEFFRTIDVESNSLALIVKHIGGNLHSRWRDLFTTDGEKPDRDRDSEFEIREDSRASLMEFWQAGWQVLFDALEALTGEDLTRAVTIRSQPHSVVQAINRQMTHYAYHIGQIVFLAKHLRASDWKNLSVPRKSSAAFNEFAAEQGAANDGTASRFELAERFNTKKEGDTP